MEIRKRFSKNIAILYISGDININSASLVEETGKLIKEGTSEILCNFVNVNMVDYNGLSIIVIAYKNVVNQKGVMKFCNVPPHIKGLFKVSRLDKIFDMHENEELGTKAFALSSKVDKLLLRRRFKRIDLSFPTRFKTGVSSTGKMLSGKALNLSGDGLFVHTKNTFPISTELYVEIDLESSKNPLVLTGTVIWLADKKLQPHAYPGMGIRIANFDGKIQGKLIDFINKHLTMRSKG